MPPSTPLLQCRQLSRLDSGRDRPLLNPTDFDLRGGDRVALTGASGCGKSVWLRTLALLEPASGGQVLWHGQPITRARIAQYRSQVCYLPQKPAMVDGSVADNLRYPFSLNVFAQARFDKAQVQRWLAAAGKAATFLDQAASQLSGGEAQVVALARVIQLKPQVLLLDEPTAALDPASALQVEALVSAWFEQAPGLRALVWITHDPQQALRVAQRQLSMTAGTLQEPVR